MGVNKRHNGYNIFKIGKIWNVKIIYEFQEAKRNAYLFIKT